MADKEIMERILNLIPQQPPFRFIDDILELDENRVVATYRFRTDEYFYKGHFPGNPVTPGVVLVETMAQSGVVALALYNLIQNGACEKSLKKITTLFALIDNVEFSELVRPGQKVIVRGEKIYFRKGNLKTKVSIEHENGELVCHGVLTGKGVDLNE